MGLKRKADRYLEDESDHESDKAEDLENDDTATELPSTINPYTVLEVEKDAPQDKIKSAYRKMALKYHPDKVSPAEKDAAHTKFQEIAFAYAILSDSTRRKRYDTTGRTSETLEDDEDFNWSDFYRSQFEDVINSSSIDKFKREYQGSDEEKLDVIAAYVDFEGDLDELYKVVMLSNPVDDEERYRTWINEEIEAGRVEAYDDYTKESKKKKKARMVQAQHEGKEAEEYAKELGVHEQLFGKGGKAGKAGKDDESGLAALIQQRQKARAGDFLAGLEAKYAKQSNGKGGSKRKKQAEVADQGDEPPEEAFAKNRKKADKPSTAKDGNARGTKGEGSRRGKRTKT